MVCPYVCSTKRTLTPCLLISSITRANLSIAIGDNPSEGSGLIDSARNASEDYFKRHIPGAINISLKDIAELDNLQKLNPDKQIVVYCYTGRTGSQATAILNTLGYDAANLLWGISGWTADLVVAPKRFNPDTSVDYPFETGTGEGAPAEPSGGGGACGLQGTRGKIENLIPGGEYPGLKYD